MTTLRDHPAAALSVATLDLPVLMASCRGELNRLARQPMLVRRDDTTIGSHQRIELLFGMDHAALHEIDADEWLRTDQDAAGCSHLVQQLQALFAAPGMAGFEISTAQRPA